MTFTTNGGAFVIVVSLLSVSLTRGDSPFFPFPSQQFAGEDATVKVFGDANKSGDVFPIAYGDFNADKLTDIIAVASDLSSVMLFLAHEEPPFLRLGKKCKVKTEGDKQELQIVGAAPGDFTGDGIMDLLVTLKHWGQKNLQVIIFEGNSTDIICKNRMETPLEMVGEPLVVDLNGDMIMDLVGEVYVDQLDYTNLERKKHIWIFNEYAKLKPSNYSFVEKGGDEFPHVDAARSMTSPPYTAFVDVDNDGIPELVMMTTTAKDKKDTNEAESFLHTYRIQQHSRSRSNPDRPPISFKYLKDPTNLGKAAGHPIPQFGQPVFVDFNQNGELLHLLPYCARETCNNKDGMVPKEQGIKVLRHNEHNVTISELPMGKVSFDNIDWGWARPIESNRPDKYLDKHDYYSRSIVLRVGDYNLDGFPDIIAVLEAAGPGNKKDKADNIIKRAVVFENTPCKEPDKCPYPRTFSPNFKLLSQYTNVTLGTFFDIHEDGLIDVLLVRKANSTTNEARFEVRAFQNRPDYDSNFIKVMVLSGNKCPRCPKLGIPYGNLIPGPVISYKTKTQVGDIQTAVAAQNYRSANMPMDLPYTIFGIGHSPNFVEVLNISISSDGVNRHHEWTQIIPNSQIIVIPSPLDDPKNWKAKLFLTPSDAVLQTFAVLLAICLVVSCIVIGIQIKEVREDRKDRLQEAHRFMM